MSFLIIKSEDEIVNIKTEKSVFLTKDHRFDTLEKAKEYIGKHAHCYINQTLVIMGVVAECFVEAPVITIDTKLKNFKEKRKLKQIRKEKT